MIISYPTNAPGQHVINHVLREIELVIEGCPTMNKWGDNYTLLMKRDSNYGLKIHISIILLENKTYKQILRRGASVLSWNINELYGKVIEQLNSIQKEYNKKYNKEDIRNI